MLSSRDSFWHVASRVWIMAFNSLLPAIGSAVDKEDYIEGVGVEFSIDELKVKQKQIDFLEEELAKVEEDRNYYRSRFLENQSIINNIRLTINETN